MTSHQQNYPPPGYPTAPQQYQQGYPGSVPQPGGYPPFQGNQQPPVYVPPGYQHNVSPIVNQPNIYNPNQSKLISTWGINSAFEWYLKNASSLHVAQKVELLEAFVGFETANKYVVKDQAGNKLFYAMEESGCCTRQCCGNARNFTMSIKDVAGQDVMLIDRPINCSLFCGLCFPDSVTVTAPGGQVLGYVQQEFSFMKPKFALKNAAGATILKVVGPFCPMACMGTVEFQVLDKLGNNCGQIQKKWGGFIRELFTDADYFSVSFPTDLDIPMKAVCLAVLFLIVSYELILISSSLSTSLP